jgi:hypothetical protein
MDDDEEIDGEIELQFEPRMDALEMFAIDVEQFEAALLEALEKHEQLCERAVSADEVPQLEDVVLVIEGHNYRLGDLADITISSDGEDEDEGEHEGDPEHE